MKEGKGLGDVIFLSEGKKKKKKKGNTTAIGSSRGKKREESLQPSRLVEQKEK